MSDRTCSVDGCERHVKAMGMCSRHYYRWHRYGDPQRSAKVMHFGTPEERFWQKVDKSAGDDGCWLWTAGTSKGYGLFHFSAGRRNERPGKAHRISYELKYGPIADGMHVCHRCDNPPCVNPAHLFLGTAADNARDRVEKGRHRTPWTMGDAPQGVKHHSAVLNDELVRIIRAASPDETTSALARRLGVSRNAVQFARLGKTWKHVQ